MRVADLNMTNPNHHCPQAFRAISSPKRMCGRQSGSRCIFVLLRKYKTATATSTTHSGAKLNLTKKLQIISNKTHSNTFQMALSRTLHHLAST